MARARSCQQAFSLIAGKPKPLKICSWPSFPRFSFRQTPSPDLGSKASVHRGDARTAMTCSIATCSCSDKCKSALINSSSSAVNALLCALVQVWTPSPRAEMKFSSITIITPFILQKPRFLPLVELQAAYPFFPSQVRRLRLEHIHDLESLQFAIL